MLIFRTFRAHIYLNFEKTTQTTLLRLLFYNLENLFDTIDDPETHDDDFYAGREEKIGIAKRYHRKNKKIELCDFSNWSRPIWSSTNSCWGC